ncbi:MAG: hypothetical protein GX221_02910 [Candidatus Riflebacteria bacterium]|nr:hypothetical protein [Candidatus Riflebacteria bacterium]
MSKKVFGLLSILLLAVFFSSAVYAEANPLSPDLEVVIADSDKKVEDKTSDLVDNPEEKKDEKEKDKEKKEEPKEEKKEVDLGEYAKYVDRKGFPQEGSVSAGVLRFREWPWGKVNTTYRRGGGVTVLGVLGEFYCIQVDGKIGFMHRNYVSTSREKATEAEPVYPPGCREGGHLEKDKGIKEAINFAKRVSEAVAGGSDPAALAGYKGGKLPPKEFLALFGPVARDSMKQTGVPASVTLAQAILETGWGASSIGDAKNLFGIKGKGPAGTARTKTQEHYGNGFVTITDGFRKYHTWQQSIDDHAKLVSGGRYKSAWDNFQRTKNADEFARGIHKAGYATDPGYANKLINLMKTHNLYQWDK